MNADREPKIWLAEHEAILKKLHKNCSLLHKSYHQAYIEYSKYYENFKIPTIIICALCCFLSFSNAGYVPPEYSKYVNLFVGILNTIATALGSIEALKNISNNFKKFYECHHDIGLLKNKIAIILLIPQNERENDGFKTITDIFTEYQQIHSKAPILKDEVQLDIINICAFQIEI